MSSPGCTPDPSFLQIQTPQATGNGSSCQVPVTGMGYLDCVPHSGFVPVIILAIVGISEMNIRWELYLSLCLWKKKKKKNIPFHLLTLSQALTH